MLSALGSLRCVRARGPLVSRWQRPRKGSLRLSTRSNAGQGKPPWLPHAGGTPPPRSPCVLPVARGLRRRRAGRTGVEGPHFRFKPALTRKLGYFRLRRLLVVCLRRERPSKLPVAASRQLSCYSSSVCAGVATRLPVASPEAAPKTVASSQPAQRRARAQTVAS